MVIRVDVEAETMSLTTVRVDVLTELARRSGLDGSDRGAVRTLVWREIGTDAVDHAVVEQVAERLGAKR